MGWIVCLCLSLPLPLPRPQPTAPQPQNSSFPAPSLHLAFHLCLFILHTASLTCLCPCCPLFLQNTPHVHRAQSELRFQSCSRDPSFSQCHRLNCAFPQTQA